MRRPLSFVCVCLLRCAIIGPRRASTSPHQATIGPQRASFGPPTSGHWPPIERPLAPHRAATGHQQVSTSPHQASTGPKQATIGPQRPITGPSMSCPSPGGALLRARDYRDFFLFFLFPFVVHTTYKHFRWAHNRQALAPQLSTIGPIMKTTTSVRPATLLTRTYH